MKKYVKPELIFESFEMTQQIAACDYVGEHSDGIPCKFAGYNDEFKMNVIILMEQPTCELPTEDYCYHASTTGYSLFTS